MQVEKAIEHKTRLFVEDLKVLLRQSALEHAGDAIRERLQGGTFPAADHRVPSSGRRKRERRTEASIAKMTRDVYAVIFEHPGLRMEELARLMSVTSKKLVVPIKRLIACGAIEGRGNTRATQYHPTSSVFEHVSGDG